MKKILIVAASLLARTAVQASDWALVTMAKSYDQAYVDDSGTSKKQ
jgi:hypothetical protein